MKLTTVTLLKNNLNLLQGAYVLKTEGGYNLVVKLQGYTDSAVATNRNPFKARVFKTIQSAANTATSLGIKELVINNGI